MKLYAAHPVSCYGSAYEARQLAALRQQFPDAELLNPAATFGSDEQWLKHWPALLAELDLVAVFADESGAIGAGVLLEVADAIGRGLPLVALNQEGKLHYFGGLARKLGLIVPRRQVGRLLYGPAVSPAMVMALIAGAVAVLPVGTG